MPRKIASFLLIGGFILLDQLSKLGVIWFFPAWVWLNPKGSWGILPSWLAFFGLAGILIWLRKNKTSNVWGAYLIIAGGISNLLDRIFWKAVIDFIKLGPLPIFNLADVTISLGLLLTLITELKIAKRKDEAKNYL